MDILPYLLTFAAGLAAGIWVEWKYGSRVNSAGTEVANAAKAINDAVDKLKGA